MDDDPIAYHEVPEGERLDFDTLDSVAEANARMDLSDVYDDPGEVLPW